MNGKFLSRKEQVQDLGVYSENHFCYLQSDIDKVKTLGLKISQNELQSISGPVGICTLRQDRIGKGWRTKA